MDDFLTETWFIVLLGTILAIIILSFGAMVFVKRKHMLMKQGALGKSNSTLNKIYSHSTVARANKTKYNRREDTKKASTIEPSNHEICMKNNL